LPYALQHFFLPHRYRDAFGNVTRVAYDAHDLAPTETTDPVENITRAELDYRVLSPRLLIDPNANRSQVAFDTLGLVAGTAVMGKIGENLGDLLDGFEPDLSPEQLETFLADPHGTTLRLLGNATTRIVYDIDRYFTSEKPVFAATFARETHVSNVRPGEQSKTQISLSYSDGFGREIQKKVQAEPGPLIEGGHRVDPRWIGSGWTIFNNKGKPVRQYEPFFSASHDFEFAEITGVSPILFYDPVERVVATLHPNNSYEKVVFDPWRQTSWDVNDTVLLDLQTDPDVGEFFTCLPESDYLPTWYRQRIDGRKGPAEKTAAEKAARHADTPTSAYFDSLGRKFLTIADDGKDEAGKDRKYPTRTLLDVEGNQRAVIDALDRIVICYDFDIIGTQLHQASLEAGERWMLNDIAGKPIRAWNSRLYSFRIEYDVLRRPICSFVRGGDPYERNAKTYPCEILFERTIYGDSANIGMTEDRRREANLRGKVYRHFDAAGAVTNDHYDFKGNLLHSSQQFAQDYKNVPDWSHDCPVEAEIFCGSATYDALNRTVTMTSPDRSVYRPGYNETNLLQRIDVVLSGEERNGQALWTSFVSNIDYNARGQRTRIDYANGTATTYHYDDKTFRLLGAQTARSPDRNAFATRIFVDPVTIQDLHYTYDPVGNITQIADGSLRTVFHDNHKVDSVCRYTYDPIYRLIDATGRENIAQSAFQFTPRDSNYRDYPCVGAEQLSDLQALRNYAECYEYDPVGNFLRMIHRAENGNWTRRYTYHEVSLIEPARKSNRLSRTHLEGSGNPVLEPCLYDANGNITQMLHLPVMQLDFMDQLAASARQVVKCGRPETTYYVYDSARQRARKVTERPNGTKKEERLYVGGFEVYREYDGSGMKVALERETLHIMDDKRRFALVDTLTTDHGGTRSVPGRLLRYQLSNHLSSASLELDEVGGLISYEEYAPYGSTVYQAGRSAAEVKRKRYRYTGKERDEENAFTYHGARYYVPWLGRWISTDPSGFADGPNLYAFGRGDPIGTVDRDGRQSDEDLDAGASSTPPDQGDAGATQQSPDQTLTVPANESGTLIPGGAAPQAQAEQGQVVKEYVPRQGEMAREEVKEKIASAARKADEFRQGVAAGAVNTPVGIVQHAAEATIKVSEIAVAHPYLTATALTKPLGLPILFLASSLREGSSNAYHAVHDAFEGVKVEYPHTAAGEFGNMVGGELATLPLAFIAGGAGRVAALEEEGAVVESAFARLGVSSGAPIPTSREMKVVRTLEKGEIWEDLVNEVEQLHKASGNEHAIVKLLNGENAIVKGNARGIELQGEVKKVFLHTHPYHLPPTGPSPMDLFFIRSLGQRSSYLLEHGWLYRFSTIAN
jgi:RHS repeat-associated protein